MLHDVGPCAAPLYRRARATDDTEVHDREDLKPGHNLSSDRVSEVPS